MAFYNVCPKCGAHLDTNEKCDCENVSEKEGKGASADSGKWHKPAWTYVNTLDTKS